MSRYQFCFVMGGLFLNVAASTNDHMFAAMFSLVASGYLVSGTVCRFFGLGEEP